MEDRQKQMHPLTKREKQILSLLAHGLNQVQVADKVYLSPHTVNFHVRNVLSKMRARNITAAVAKAIQEQHIVLSGHL